jgi:hypothetical protein
MVDRQLLTERQQNAGSLSLLEQFHAAYPLLIANC